MVQSLMRIENAIAIDVPIEQLWAITIDVESWPGMSPTMTKVERLDTGEMVVGSRATIKQPFQMARVWTVTELRPPEIFAWATSALGMTMTARHALAHRPRGSVNTLTIDIEGRASGLVGAMVRRSVLAALITENKGFKAAAERGVGGLHVDPKR